MYLVSIEFLRVQTFLFAVPRLRAMIGANVLLGEVIRKDLVNLARQYSCSPLACIVDAYPEADPDQHDPLIGIDSRRDSSESYHEDNPRKLIDQGILSRDGGHFKALFADEDSAFEFKTEAESCIRKQLPGLRFEIEVHLLSDLAKKDSAHAKPAKLSQSRCLDELPIFEICQETGKGIANRYEKPPKATDPIPMANQVHKIRRKGDDFFDRRGRKETADIIGLLKQMGQLPLTEKDWFEAPETLNDLCGDDMLAVIHADGNSIGKKFGSFRDQSQGQLTACQNTDLSPFSEDEVQWFLKEARAEKFFHSMRVGIRHAVIQALKQTFRNYPKGERYLPYQLLMLGGDDLVMVCRAQYAFDFIVNYAQALENHSWGDSGPISIGAGIAIAHPNVPFHRLHHLAEELASSAKRLYRAYEKQGEDHSVVDWMIFSEAWAEDPIARRKQDHWERYWVNGKLEELVLTARPYKICGDFLSLDALLDATRGMEGKIRSQLRALAEAMKQGRLSSELAFDEMPKETQKIIADALEEVQGKDQRQLWLQDEKTKRYTSLLWDLVDMRELLKIKDQ